MKARGWIGVAMASFVACQVAGAMPPPWTLDEAKANAEVVVLARIGPVEMPPADKGGTGRAAFGAVQKLKGEPGVTGEGDGPFLTFQVPPSMVMVAGYMTFVPEQGETVLLFLSAAKTYEAVGDKRVAREQPGYYTAAAGGTGFMRLDREGRRRLYVTDEYLSRMKPEAAQALEGYYAQARQYVAPKIELDVQQLPGAEGLSERMASYYEPVKVDVKPAAGAYSLPLSAADLTNGERLNELIRDEAARGMFLKNGLVVTDAGRLDEVATFYRRLKGAQIPVFVTSDSLLHLYHIQFSETLKGIEEREFNDDLIGICEAMQKESGFLYQELEGDQKEAARRVLGFFTVAVEILAEDTVLAKLPEIRKQVEKWPDGRPGLQIMMLQGNEPDVMQALSTVLGPEVRTRTHVRRDSVKLDSKQNILYAIDEYTRTHENGKITRLARAQVPEAVAEEVRGELKLIGAQQGFAESPLFSYREDYSQYVPRGHYTRSEVLKRYFKAMMWLGRMSFLIKGAEGAGQTGPALVSEEEARIQTLAASIMASVMGETQLARPGREARTVAQAWDRIYAVTAYYVGLADDLGPYEYRGAMRGVFGARFRAVEMNDDAKWTAYRMELAKLRSPEIYGGTGEIVGPPGDVATEADLMAALGKTAGMRFMGQRYVPDSYLMGRLVYPTVGPFTGLTSETSAFTLVQSPGGLVRGFPRGLDVMAVLGSERALEILKKEGDTDYERYEETLARLRGEFGALSEADWNRNMYWSWLHCLKALLADYGEGYPTFMQTAAWKDKQLSAALGSWAQLRHDTILYAKQSYTMTAGSAPMPPKMVEGYVEPAVEFYARLLALTRMSRKGLEDMEALDDGGKARLERLEGILERLLAISVKELQNAALDEREYEFIRSFGDQLKGAVAGVAEQGLETTIVADVHTDQNSMQALEEGTGYLRTAYVAYPMPDGGVVVGAGPVLSYYEFKKPISERLTDEAWKALLGSEQAPALPEWTGSFSH